MTVKDHRVTRQAKISVPTNGPRSPRTPFIPRFPGTPCNEYILFLRDVPYLDVP